MADASLGRPCGTYLSRRRSAKIKEDHSFSCAMVNKMEYRSRWLFVAGLSIVILNRVLDQVSANIGAPFLSTPLLMITAVVLLSVRLFIVSLGCELKRVGIVTIVLGLSLASWVLSGQSYLLVASLLLLGLGEIDVQDLVQRCSVVLLLVIALFGILQAIQLVLYGDAPGSVVREGGRLRLSFFFRHPNMLAAYVAMAYIGCASGRRRFSGAMALFGFALAFVSFLVTDSRTSTAIIVLYICLRLALRDRGSLTRVVKIGYLAAPAVFIALAAMVATSSAPNYLVDVLQVLLSGRPGYWQLQYQVLGDFTLFGQHALSGTVVYNNWLYQNVTIDCFYVASLLSLGAWSLVVFYCLYLRVGLRSLESCDWSAPVAMFCCALYGFTEIHIVDFAVAIPMLFMGSNLFVPVGYND